MNIQEAYRTPNRLDQKRNSSSHIIIRTTNALNKDRILKAVREKGQVTYKGRPIRVIDFYNYRLLIRDYESQKILDRCYTDSKRTQMPAKAAIPSNTLNYHRWRNQSIPRKKPKFTQYHSTNPALQRIIKGKHQHKDGKYALEKARK